MQLKSVCLIVTGTYCICPVLLFIFILLHFLDICLSKNKILSTSVSVICFECISMVLVILYYCYYINTKQITETEVGKFLYFHNKSRLKGGIQINLNSNIFFDFYYKGLSERGLLSQENNCVMTASSQKISALPYNFVRNLICCFKNLSHLSIFIENNNNMKEELQL